MALEHRNSGQSLYPNNHGRPLREIYILSANPNVAIMIPSYLSFTFKNLQWSGYIPLKHFRRLMVRRVPVSRCLDHESGRQDISGSSACT